MHQQYLYQDIDQFFNGHGRDLLKEQPVFFVGSGISIFAPTLLPTGMSFTSDMFDFLFPDYKISHSYLRELFNELPFEALMDSFPDHKKLFPVIANIFNIDRSNPLHELLSEALDLGWISAIITPNYDLCFDTCLKRSQYCSLIRTEQDLSLFTTGAYFKIHGCASGIETPVCTLTQEENLPEWKTRLLARLLENRTLIFIGYSGRDFDICPVIKNRALFKYKRIVWLDYNPSFKSDTLSGYAKDLLQSASPATPNLVLNADMRVLLSRLFSRQISAATSFASFDPEVYFKISDEEKLWWRLNLLNRLNCPLLGLENLHTIPIDRRGIALKRHFLVHRGLYKAAAINMKEVVIKTNRKKDPESYIRNLLVLAGCYMTYGNTILSLKLFNKAKKWQEEKLADHKELRYVLINKELGHCYFVFKSTCLKYIPFAKTYLKHQARKLIIELDLLDSQGIGNLKDRQRFRHSMEGFLSITSSGAQIDRELRRTIEDILGRISVPLASQDGFTNMGLPLLASMSFRSNLLRALRSSTGSKLSKGQFLELNHFYHRSVATGMYPETWKFARLVALHGTSRLKRLAYLKKWNENLRKCEYSFFKRNYLLWEILICRVRIYW